ncbi:MAG: Crp/Fnr family transcriptional regulator [Erysipelotrichaceae bacterium]
MDNLNTEILAKNILFDNIPASEIIELLRQLESFTKEYPKNTAIYHVGDYIEDLGIIISGEIVIYKYDESGNASIISNFQKNEIFGEVLVANNQPLPYDVLATKETNVLYLNFQNLTKLNKHKYQSILIQNFIKCLSDKLILLNQRIQILSERSIKNKLLSYLKSQTKNKNQEIIIPFNREQLANFLGVDRSALSYVLMQLKQDNIIDYHKNTFKLY